MHIVTVNTYTYSQEDRVIFRNITVIDEANASCNITYKNEPH